MEIDRKELKRQSRERMALTDPKFWVVALTYLAMTIGVSWLFSLVPTSSVGPSPVPAIDTLQLFLQLLLMLYRTVVQFGLCLWALWTYRRLDPGLNSLIQGFSVAGRVILMELGIYVRTLGWYFLAALGMTLPLFAILFMTNTEAAYMIAILLFAAGLVVTLIVLALRYALAPYLLADRPDDGPSLPIHRSVQLMRGWKWELFKLEFSFIGWEFINFVLGSAVYLFFLRQAGLLTPELFQSQELLLQAQEVIYSTPVTIISTLVTVPVSLWLIPYRATARAGFYDARLAVSKREDQAWPEMPPL